MATKPAEATASYISANTIAANHPGQFTDTYTPGTYTSQYAGQISQAMNDLMNWKYDPLQDASYQALAKVYAQRGELAAKNSLGDAAALNGGYGTSYAVSAAQQARNQYNQELASYIPDLEANAYTKAANKLTYLQNADDTEYGRFRDTESDKQFVYNANYQKYRDAMSDYQWAMGYNQDATQYANTYNQNEKQWAANYNLDRYSTIQSLKKSSSSGSGSSSSGVGYTGTALSDLWAKSTPKKTTKKTTTKLSHPTGNSGNWKGTSSKKSSTSGKGLLRQTAGNEKQVLLNKNKKKK